MRNPVFVTLFVAATTIAFSPGAKASSPAVCARAEAGSPAYRPPDLYSSNGVLSVTLNYLTTVDDAGRTNFCFQTPDGLESPTLHVHPGDTLKVSVANQVPPLPPGQPVEQVNEPCAAATMTGTTVNMHFHGTNTSPQCHGDDVIHTEINSGTTFQYSLKFPTNEPPGLYWYHPHVHGIAEAAVQGGATGAIVVEGIAAIQPAVAGLPEQILVIRDQTVASAPVGKTSPPAWDVSLNYVPVAYPSYTPAVLSIQPGERQFWRVVNASADTIINLALVYDGKAQPLEVVGLDGVPTGSQDGTRRGKTVSVNQIRMPPGGRAEFIMTGPAPGVTRAQLVTRVVDTGPDGDSDPARPLAQLKVEPQPQTHAAMTNIAASSSPAWPQRFENLAATAVTMTRKLYFSEVLSDPNNPASPTNFYITVDGAKPTLFDVDNPPAITTKQGSVEDWTIENRAGENHEFHIHQIHFKLLQRNGVAVPPDEQQWLDTVDVPYWSGSGPYPSVNVRMDFRGSDIGDFVYHCHILGHEDNGMMAIIRVLPKS